MGRYSLRRIGGVVLAAAAVGLGVGVWQGGVVGGGGGGGGTSTLANLWIVNAGAGTCTRSASAVAYSVGTSCSSFDAAYRAASKGDTVNVVCSGNGSCSYPSQLLALSSAKSISGNCLWPEPFIDGTTANDQSSCIKFQNGAGSAPVIGHINIAVPYVWLSGLTTSGGIDLGRAADAGGTCAGYNVIDTIIQNQTIQSGLLNSEGSSYLFIIGGTYNGPANSSSNIKPCDVSSADHSATATHVAVDGATFRDYTQTDPSAHDECIHWQDTDQGIVQSSKFLNCAQQDISFHPAVDGSVNFVLNHFLIRNNVFDDACSNQPAPCAPVGTGGGVNFGCVASGTVANFFIYNNSFATSHSGLGQDSNLNTCHAGSGGVTVTGNIMAGPDAFSCSLMTGSSGFVYDYNIFFNATGCGTHALTGATNVYTNPAPTAYDYTQKAGSPSLGYVAITCPTTTDILGHARPGTGCDAGAYEQ